MKKCRRSQGHLLFCFFLSDNQASRSRWQDLTNMTEAEMQRSMARFFAREGENRAKRSSTQRWAAALCDPTVQPTLSAHKLLGVHFKGFDLGCLEHVCKLPPAPPKPEEVEDIWASCLADHGMMMLYTFAELCDLVQAQPESSIAIGYCRTSAEAKAGEERSTSLHRQKAALKDLRGIIAIGFFYCLRGEASYKAFDDPDRPASALATKALQDSAELCLAFNQCFVPSKMMSTIEYLAIPDITRFSRDTRLGLEAVELLKSMNVKLASSRDSIDYIAGGQVMTSSSAFIFTIMLAKAQMEREDIQHRTSAGQTRRWDNHRKVSHFSSLLASSGGIRSHLHISDFALEVLPLLAQPEHNSVQDVADHAADWLGQDGESQAAANAYIPRPTNMQDWRRRACKWKADLEAWLADQPDLTADNAAELIRAHILAIKGDMAKAVRARVARD